LMKFSGFKIPNFKNLNSGMWKLKSRFLKFINLKFMIQNHEFQKSGIQLCERRASGLLLPRPRRKIHITGLFRNLDSKTWIFHIYEFFLKSLKN
jgi:hypothetical protein